MQADSNFTKSIHLCIYLSLKDGLVSSSEFAESLKTNPVVVRRLIAILKKSHIIGSVAGSQGGFFLEKTPKEITLWDIYIAVKEKDFFNRPKVNPNCIVSSNLAALVHDTFMEVDGEIVYDFFIGYTGDPNDTDSNDTNPPDPINENNGSEFGDFDEEEEEEEEEEEVIIQESPEPVGDPYVPQEGDVFVNGITFDDNGMPISTQEGQLGNTCVLASMGYMNNDIFGGNENYGKYILWSMQNQEREVLQNGLTGNQAEELVKRFFRTTEAGDIESKLAKGYPVMTSVLTGLSEMVPHKDYPDDPDKATETLIAHNVVIIGSQGDKYIVFDPQFAEFRVVKKADAGIGYILGVKNKK